MLKGTELMAIYTIDFINCIVKDVEETSREMKRKLPKLYFSKLVKY